MNTIIEHIRKHILTSCGVLPEKRKLPSLEILKKTEWSERFEILMRNRLIMGAFRYGRLKEANKPTYNFVDALIDHLNTYKKDGNLEHLVDIANIALLEFEESKHPLKHFKTLDDSKHIEE